MHTLDFIKELRNRTGLSIKECHTLSYETNCDIEKALSLVSSRGILIANKLHGRQTGASRVFSYVHSKRIGVLLELACETDFAANTDDFGLLGNELCLQIASMKPNNIEELMSQDYIRNQDVLPQTVEVFLKNVSAKLGENVSLVRFCRIEAGEIL